MKGAKFWVKTSGPDALGPIIQGEITMECVEKGVEKIAVSPILEPEYKSNQELFPRIRKKLGKFN